MLKSFTCFVFFLSLCSFASFGQKKSSSVKSENVLINKHKPSVYIEFIKSGELEALRTSDTNQRLWLRLYNNSIWTINFCSFEVEREYGQIGMIYDVRLNPPVIYGGKDNLKAQNPPPQKLIPLGYSGGDTCSPYYLRSGKSVEFSVPREHLQEPDYFIEILFHFEWEVRDSTEGSPSTLVRFFNINLPALERYKKVNLEEYWHKEFLRKRDPIE